MFRSRFPPGTLPGLPDPHPTTLPGGALAGRAGATRSTGASRPPLAWPAIYWAIIFWWCCGGRVIVGMGAGTRSQTQWVRHVVDPETLGILGCPLCGGRLRNADDGLSCPADGGDFPMHPSGLLDLRPPDGRAGRRFVRRAISRRPPCRRLAAALARGRAERCPTAIRPDSRGSTGRCAAKAGQC